MNFVDRFLNSITMYRLLLYGLLILSFISIAFGFLNLLPYSGWQFISLLFLLIVSCLVTQLILVFFFKAIMNVESFLITALILFFILSPIITTPDVYISLAAGAIAMASKFLLAISRKHIFNPVAIAVFLLGLFGYGNGIWWVGSQILLPFVIIVGFLVVRKIRRFQLLFTFLAASVTTIVLVNVNNGLTIQQSLSQSLFSWPVIFFGTIMLTEPLTTPPSHKLYLLYGLIVGVLFGSQFHFGPIFASPELSLVIGNIFSYLVSPKGKFLLQFQSQHEAASEVYEFSFSKPRGFNFTPGQYMEWTLPQSQTDGRGNRRYFTLASSPTEPDIKLGVKVPSGKPSSFKQILLAANGQILAGQLSGDFLLPSDTKQKLVFIAGGIGVTPFRSMAKYLTDQQQTRDVVLFYVCSSADEFAYQDIFTAAQSVGFKTVYVVSHPEDAPANWSGEVGRLNQEMLSKHVPNLSSRIFYISGPNAMVEAYKQLLHSLRVPRSRIVTDYFPGF